MPVDRHDASAGGEGAWQSELMKNWCMLYGVPPSCVWAGYGVYLYVVRD